MADSQIDIVVKARDEASDIIEKAGGALEHLGSFAADAGVAVAAAGVAIAAAALAAGIAIFNAGEQAESAFAKMQASTGATGEDFAKMQQAAFDLQSSTTASLTQITDVLSELHKKWGITGQDAEDAAKHVLAFSKVTGIDATTAVKSLDDVLDSWGKTAADSTHIMDELLFISQKTGANVQDMSDALGRQAGALMGLGFTMDQAIGLYGRMASAGLDASDASMALTHALKSIKTPEDLTTLTEKIHEMKDPTEQAQAAMELFGSKAGPRLVPLLKQGAISVDDLTASLAGADGALQKASDVMDHTFGAQMDILKNKVVALAEQVGLHLPDAFTSLLEKVNATFPTFDQLTKWWDNIRTGFTAAVSEFENKTHIISQLQDSFASVWKVIQQQLMPALADLWKNMQPLMPVFEALAKVVGAVLVLALKLAIEALTLAVELFAELLTAGANVASFILKELKPAFDTAQGFISALVAPIQAVIDTFNAMKAAASSAIAAAGNVVSGAASSVSNAVSKVVPHFASGGIVTSPTLALVGEAGPEAIIPLSGGARGIPGLSGGPQNVNIELFKGASVTITSDSDIQSLTDQVTKSIARLLQAQRLGLSTPQ